MDTRGVEIIRASINNDLPENITIAAYGNKYENFQWISVSVYEDAMIIFIKCLIHSVYCETYQIWLNKVSNSHVLII